MYLFIVLVHVVCISFVLFFTIISYLTLPLFFFLMIRRPPRSTLFPSRRSSDLFCFISCGGRSDPCQKSQGCDPRPQRKRSEEHTSELQSLRHLVCRLLLEKKKKKQKK